MINNTYLSDADLPKVKWMCYNVYITTDKQVFNIHTGQLLKERWHNGLIGYTVSGQFRTKKWINEHCVNVEGFIDI